VLGEGGRKGLSTAEEKGGKGRRKEWRKGREEGEGGRRERGHSSEIEPLAILIF